MPEKVIVEIDAAQLSELMLVFKRLADAAESIANKADKPKPQTGDLIRQNALNDAKRFERHAKKRDGR